MVRLLAAKCDVTSTDDVSEYVIAMTHMIYHVTSGKGKQKSEQLIAGSQRQLQRRAVLQSELPHFFDHVA